MWVNVLKTTGVIIAKIITCIEEQHNRELFSYMPTIIFMLFVHDVCFSDDCLSKKQLAISI